MIKAIIITAVEINAQDNIKKMTENIAALLISQNIQRVALELLADLLIASKADLRRNAPRNERLVTPTFNEHLANAVCEAYQRNPSKFKPIIYALYMRDKAECEEIGLLIPPSPQAICPIDIGMYLNHMADNHDLKAILEFVRFEY